MPQKSIRKNYIYNLTYQILILITPLITTPYLSRVLGADGIGTYSYIESIASYFTLFATLGLTILGQREISYVQENRTKRTIIFWEINIIEFIVTTISIVVYVIFSIHQKDSVLYLVLIFNLFAVIANITWFFQGIEEFGKIVSRNIFFKILNIIFILVYIKSKDDLIWYMLGTSLFTFLSNISLWLYLPKYVDLPKWKELNPFCHIGVIVSLFIPTIAGQIYTVLDKTMIGIITKSPYENGYYEQAIKMARMVLTIVTSLSMVMVPRIGFYFKKGDFEYINKLMYKSYRFVWMLSIPLCFGLNCIANNFVPWFFGEEYNKVIPLLKILSFLIIAIGISNLTGIQYLIPTKRQNIFTITIILGAVTNLMMNIFLIPKFYALGAAIASVTAEFIVSFSQLTIISHELSVIQILKESKNYLYAGSIMVVILSVINKTLLPSIINTFIMIIIGSIVYFISLIIMKDNFLFSNIRFILRKLKK